MGNSGMIDQQTKSSISNLVLKPIFIAWSFAIAASVILGIFAIYNELLESIELERKNLTLISIPIARSMEGEILLGNSGVVEPVRELLRVHHGLMEIRLNQTDDLSCNRKKSHIVNFLAGKIAVCLQVSISAPGPYRSLSIIRNVPSFKPIMIAKVVSLTMLPFLALASSVFWIITKKLNRYVILPIIDLEKYQLQKINSFIYGDSATSLSLPPQESKELSSLIQMIEINARDLRFALAEKQDLEAQHVQAQAIVRTIRMVSHDLRSPIALAGNLIDILLRCKSLEEMRIQLAETKPELARAIQSINGTLSDLMVAGGNLKLNKENVTISNLLHAAVQELLISFPSLDGRIEYTSLVDRLWKIDQFKMLRVLGNLLNNAAQEIHQKSGKITIHAECLNNNLSIRIENTGSSIQPEHLPTLFEPFFTFGKLRGTGLGLAIVRQIIEAHGGSVNCVTGGPPKVCFELILPPG
jgi:signal transduction histidine kinase